MKKFTSDEIDYIKSNAGKISIREIATNLNRAYNTTKNKVRSLGLAGKEIGKSKFSRRVRRYDVNDYFFDVPNRINSYWAGFISADGNISIKGMNKTLSLNIASKDLSHIERFRDDLKSNNPIHFCRRGQFESCGINISSSNIVDKLESIFNITVRKTFTNIPPKLLHDSNIDSYIMGYIDGDGCIVAGRRPKGFNSRISLSLLGTLEICQWIRDRCNKILERSSGSISKRGKMYSLTFGSKASRELIGHFKKLDVPYLYRKWDKGLSLEIAENERGYHAKKGILQIDPSTGAVINEFDSAHNANEFLGKKRTDTSICNHLAGRIKKAHNYIWKFKN